MGVSVDQADRPAGAGRSPYKGPGPWAGASTRRFGSSGRRRETLGSTSDWGIDARPLRGRRYGLCARCRLLDLLRSYVVPCATYWGRECTAAGTVVHRRCHRMVSRESRGRSSVAQGVTGLRHEGEGCTIRQVEEFRVSDKSGDCCQIPQRREWATFSWLPAGGADRERRPHIQHSAPCRPCVPPPRRNRRSGDCVYRCRAGSLGGSVGLVLILRGSQCISREVESNGYHCLYVPTINNVSHDFEHVV